MKKLAMLIVSVGALVACQTQSNPEATKELNTHGMPSSTGDSAEPMVDPDDASAADALAARNATEGRVEDDLNVETSAIPEGSAVDSASTDLEDADADRSLAAETGCGLFVISTSPGAVGDPCMTQEMVNAGYANSTEGLAH